jgi:hypothetical protein
VTSPAAPFPRAARLDAAAMADALHAATGVRLAVEGPCRGGQVGAAYVRWPDGRRAVLKWRPDATLATLRSGPLAVQEAMAARGYPAPPLELAAQVGPDVVSVHGLLPGAMVDRLDAAGLEQALTLNAAQAGALADRPDITGVELFLRQDGPGFCLHEPLRRFSRRTADLERWVAAVGAEHPGPLPGADAVHLDFHPGNLLASGGAITGVVDWDGAGRGDRRLDLVTLRFGLHPDHAGADVVARLDAVLDALPARVLRPAWAHMSLRMTDWAIRHFPPHEVDTWLDLAEQRAA